MYFERWEGQDELVRLLWRQVEPWLNGMADTGDLKVADGVSNLVLVMRAALGRGWAHRWRDGTVKDALQLLRDVEPWVRGIPQAKQSVRDIKAELKSLGRR